jgi:5-methylcytosine-specific restriction endonuclease McrA
MRRYDEKFSKFYNSKEWKILRASKMAAANGLCEECARKKIFSVAKEVHHIIPIEKDPSLALDFNNLMALCSECHNAVHDRQSKLQNFLQFWDKLI